MSWPDDSLPRFIVRTVTGYRINPAAVSYSSGHRLAPVSAYVLDRAYCDRVVAAFRRAHRWQTSEDVVADATRRAAQLNQLELVA